MARELGGVCSAEGVLQPKLTPARAGTLPAEPIGAGPTQLTGRAKPHGDNSSDR